MTIVTGLSFFLLLWCLLFLLDFYLRTHYRRYAKFAERFGFQVSPFQIRFYVSRMSLLSGQYGQLSLTRSGSKIRLNSRWLRFQSIWFSIGAFISLVCLVLTPLYLFWLLVNELGSFFPWRSDTYPSDLRAAPNNELITPNTDNLFYIPLREHVQTGITPVLPGFNIPISHLPVFMIVLIIAGVFHEAGHAVAAANANIRLNGFGVFLFIIYPGAFTEIESDELHRSSYAQKLRIFGAGIWHNLVLAFFGVLLLWAMPTIMSPLFTTGAGVGVTNVSPKSGLYGPSGLQPGYVVTRINDCVVRDLNDWTQCFRSIHAQRKSALKRGYLAQYGSVLKMTASPERVKSMVDGEVQCCSEFENVTLSSHICFRYDVPTVDNYRQFQQQKQFPFKANAAKNFGGSLGLKNQQKNSRVKRANILKNFPQQIPDNFTSVDEILQTKAHSENLNKSDDPPIKSQHACLPAIQIAEHAGCEYSNQSDLKLPFGYVCVVPALYNSTVLLRFALRDRQKPVLFIGFLNEPLFMVDLIQLTPRFGWIPSWPPLMFELFGKYLITFSLAMGILNSVPVYGLDGQFICTVLIDYFCGHLQIERRQRICNLIVMLGTIIFCSNVIIGFIKFSSSEWI